VIEALQPVLVDDQRVAYAIAFGSTARGEAREHSDCDVAVGLAKGVRLSALQIGELVARLEVAAGRSVDLVLIDEAPPGLAYRIFRDGCPIVVHDADAMTERKVRAILEYLDFQPIEALCARGVLDKRHGR
jgi:predicted nucleotidyltransferase